MSRHRWFAVAGVALASAVLLASLVRPAAAQRPFSIRSLNGTYIGSVVEIRQDPAGVGPIEYCDISGTIVFDGAGSGTSDITRRCSIAGTVTDAETLTYVVGSDGSLDIAFSSGDAGHARLADAGRLAFVSAVGDPDARILVRSGVFAKR
jgi:hypothetical protein